MAGKWWGTVNLPAVVAGPCNAPWHHGPARAESRWVGGRLLAHEEHAERMEKEGKERRPVSYAAAWSMAYSVCCCQAYGLLSISLLNSSLLSSSLPGSTLLSSILL